MGRKFCPPVPKPALLVKPDLVGILQSLFQYHRDERISQGINLAREKLQAEGRAGPLALAKDECCVSIHVEQCNDIVTMNSVPSSNSFNPVKLKPLGITSGGELPVRLAAAQIFRALALFLVITFSFSPARRVYCTQFEM